MANRCTLACEATVRNLVRGSRAISIVGFCCVHLYPASVTTPRDIQCHVCLAVPFESYTRREQKKKPSEGRRDGCYSTAAGAGPTKWSVTVSLDVWRERCYLRVRGSRHTRIEASGRRKTVALHDDLGKTHTAYQRGAFIPSE